MRDKKHKKHAALRQREHAVLKEIFDAAAVHRQALELLSQRLRDVYAVMDDHYETNLSTGEDLVDMEKKCVMALEKEDDHKDETAEEREEDVPVVTPVPAGEPGVTEEPEAQNEPSVTGLLEG